MKVDEIVVVEVYSLRDEEMRMRVGILGGVLSLENLKMVGEQRVQRR